MPRRTTSAPKHRATRPGHTSPAGASTASPPLAPRHRARRSAVTWRLGIALAVTGAAATTTGAAATGVLPGVTRAGDGAARIETVDLTAASPRALTALTPERAAALLDRGQRQVSRSESRRAVDPRKAALLRNEMKSGGQVSRTKELGGGDPRTIAQVLLPQFGFGSDQFSCLDALWTKESGWNVSADNPTSSAYGIPQALPGTKMATAGADWADNPVTQIRWGLGYIRASYGTPCGAWAHSQSYNWY